MEKAIKTLAICIVIAALIVSATMLVNGRYEVYPTGHTTGAAIRLDTITGDVKALTLYPGVDQIYVVPSKNK